MTPIFQHITYSECHHFYSNTHDCCTCKLSHFVYTLFINQFKSNNSFHSSDIHFLFSVAESMKAITIWDIALLLEAVVYVIFAGLVALEYCSTSYNVYCNETKRIIPLGM